MTAGPGAVGAAVPAERLGLWAPVLLGAGIAAYTALRDEPSVTAIAAIALTGAAAAGLHAAGRLRPAAAALALLCAGFLLMKACTAELAAPAISRAGGPYAITGFLRDVTALPGGGRRKIDLDVIRIDGLPPVATPARLRLAVPEADALKPGMAVLLPEVFLRPLAGPVAPGAHDFAMAQWFARIGGTGFARAPPQRLDGMDMAAPLPLRLWGGIASLRAAMGERIRAVLGPGQRAAFAEALITGERGGIDAKLTEDMQVSGLAHILSISGLHMALVAGGIFWLVRALLALVPFFVRCWPIRKIAAIAALLTGGAYLLLSGNDVATLRSAIMLAIAFMAMLIDRSAFNMRGVALAATVILLATPEAILTASMQMSFLAVMAIIALYEAAGELGLIGSGSAPLHGFRARAAFWGFGLIGASLAAGLATAPVAAYHFNRLSPWSLAANLLSEPLMSFAVMPAGLAAALAMPFGLEAWPLRLMGAGLDGVMWIAASVARWPGARAMLPALWLPGVLVICGGLMLVILMRGRLRLIGLPVLAVGLVLAPLQARPDLIVERTAKLAALRNAEGRLALTDSRRARFAAKRWLMAEGEDIAPSAAAKRVGWSCGADHICTGELGAHRVIYLPRAAEALSALPCAAGDIVIAEFPLRRRCAGARLVIDRFAVWKHGAQAVRLNSAGEPEVTTAAEIRGRRPWVTPPQPQLRTPPLLPVSSGG